MYEPATPKELNVLRQVSPMEVSLTAAMLLGRESALDARRCLWIEIVGVMCFEIILLNFLAPFLRARGIGEHPGCENLVKNAHIDDETRLYYDS